MMAAPEIDIDRIPAALRERAQWLVWRFVKKAGAAKPSKMPYYANGHLPLYGRSCRLGESPAEQASPLGCSYNIARR